jgi:hypothetical protein
MIIQISHSADGNEWFVISPAPGEAHTTASGTTHTSEMAVESLLSAGRSVYALDVTAGSGRLRWIPVSGSNA